MVYFFADCEYANNTLRLWTLSRSTPPGVGMLQICESNIWQAVCADFWDSNDAIVACRQLGYNGTGMVQVMRLTYVDPFTLYRRRRW